MGIMTIDGQSIEFTDEPNVLSVIRKAGIDIPTLCYHSELSIYGACRLCKVENDRGKTFASCSEKPKDGMVIDFSILKKLIQEQIISKLDHSLMINENAPTDKLDALGQMYERHHVVPFQPTSENMVVYIAEIVKPLLPEHIELFCVRLYETSSSFAEWYAEDN